jgi:hypothetical protein
MNLSSLYFRAVGADHARASTWFLLCAFVISAGFKISVIGVGSPFITIDDKTAFDAGFLVWFGHAPPQRMYIESWLYGLTCLSVYVVKSLAGLANGSVGVDLITNAYRDFYGDPSAYVLAYRWLTLFLDLLTAFFVFRIGRKLFEGLSGIWAAAIVAALYLFSYNTIWSGVVSRPDSFVAFFSTLGLLLYLHSDSGRKTSLFVWSAMLLGLAAGLKLHAAFTVILLCADLIRVHGVKESVGKVFLLGGISFFFFCFGAGSLFFDPLTYLKLRMANYKDDFSPWIKPGDQLWTLLRGTGWLTVPLVAVGAWTAFKRDTGASERVRTMAVLAVGWLLLFASIRQLRAYWMLPALPIFYAVAVYGAVSLPKRAWGAIASALLLAILLTQSALQVQDLRRVPYTELQDWLARNAEDRTVYILGHDALMLPKNTRCMERTRRAVAAIIERDRAAGLSFTERHLKNWEERTVLRTFDMLESSFEPGYEFYDFFTTPPNALVGILDVQQMDFLLLQAGFDLDKVPELKQRLASEYEMVAEKIGAGGGVRGGLHYKIYRRL